MTPHPVARYIPLLIAGDEQGLRDLFVGAPQVNDPRLGWVDEVIFVPFAGSAPSGAPIDVLTGFLADRGDAYGRPVGVAIDKRGGLLVADDVGNVVWRVSGSAGMP